MSHIQFAIPVAIATLIVTLACSAIDLTLLGGRMVRGSGRVVEERRDIGSITGVNLAAIGTLTIEVGDEASLRISAEDNLLPLIKSDVQSGMLTIETEPRTNLRTTRPVRYTLTVVSLDEIALSSSGNAVAGDLNAEDFTLRLSSSGSFSMGELTCETLTVRVSSSGNAKLEGATGNRIDASLSSSGGLTIDGGAFDRQTVRMSSSGDYQARGVRSREASLTLSSSGSATVWVEEALTASLSSSGSVRYAGDPTLQLNSSSSGVVRPLND